MAAGRRWLDGTAYWGGVQLDECAFPILLIDLLLREKMLNRAMPTVSRKWSWLLPVSSCATAGNAAGSLGGGRGLLAVYARRDGDRIARSRQLPGAAPLSL